MTAYRVWTIHFLQQKYNHLWNTGLFFLESCRYLKSIISSGVLSISPIISTSHWFRIIYEYKTHSFQAFSLLVKQRGNVKHSTVDSRFFLPADKFQSRKGSNSSPSRSKLNKSGTKIEGGFRHSDSSEHYWIRAYTARMSF